MAETQQQAIIIQETGKPLVKIARPIPTPKENEVLIKITSGGINPHDAKCRDFNLFRLPLPMTICNDVAGVITAKGDKVSPDFQIHDRVFGYSAYTIDGQASQQYCVLEVGCFAKVPSNITDDQAATIPVSIFASALSFWSDKLLGFPAPWINKSTDTSAQAIVVLGGGGSCGKFAVQLAKITGIGKIIVVASKSNTDELKSFGATHVIDRHGTNAEIKARVQEVVGGEINYVYDPINLEHSLAISLLSEKKKGKVITLLPAKPSQGNYDIVQTFGVPHLHRGFSAEFFKLLPGWIESGEIKPLRFKLLEGGLDVDAFNKILNDHRDGKNSGKWHFHPNDA